MKTLFDVKPIANDLRETEHTPGPWRADEWATGWSVGAVKAQYTVCVLNDLQNPESNARLIAAAPDLLEALEKMVSLISDLHGDRLKSSTVENALSAIAKAKGGL